MTPEDKNWHSDIESPQVVDDPNGLDWDHSADVIVVGMGGAGVACALQSLELGQSVIALDRFAGGGATAASGGVIYAGGGTPIQNAAGVEDSVENMFNYLKMEIGEIVTDETLMDFCRESAPTIEWMQSHGVDLRPTLWAKKTSYPAPQYFLYHSDNSLVPHYAANATPAARGHRGYVPIEQGRKATNLGGSLFEPLLESAKSKGLITQTYTEARQILIDANGHVIGLKALQFENADQQNEYIRLRAKAHRLMQVFPPIIPGSKFFMRKALKMLDKAKALETSRSEVFIRAKKGVLLSAGGFVFNSNMLAHYAPKYSRAYPLGTDGDTGAGIRLGQSVGGQAGNMDRVTAWRFINPPISFAKGLIVNQSGERFINEMVYGATMGVEMVENHDGEAWLILDKPLAKQALEDVGGDKALAFQKALAQLNVRFGAKKAKTIDELAKIINVPAEALKAQIRRYNSYAAGEAADPFHKTQTDVIAIETPPYIAINIGLSASLFPCPALTLGGLIVDEKTGQVLGDHNRPIQGLYAAGRNAIGVASWNYISGLSIADGVYSGRRAARAMAE